MLMEWRTILLDSSIPPDENSKILSPTSIHSEFKNEPKQTSVIQTHYGINDINYKVSLDEPKLMVENEIYFPGWTATLVFPDHEEKLQAIEVNDAFRAWALPAGEYEMKANFQFPNFVTYQIISLSAFATCILVFVGFWRKLKDEKLSLKSV